MSAYDDAVGRLDPSPPNPYYNLSAYSEVNPGGLGGYGHRISFFALLADLLTLASGLLAKAAAAAASAASSADSAASAMNAPGTKATSVTSLTVVNTGDVSLEIQADKALAPGQRIAIARTSAPAATAMFGALHTYDEVTGDLVVTIDAAVGVGLGPFTDWTVSVSPSNVVEPPLAGTAGQFMKSTGAAKTWAQPATTDLSDIAAYTLARKKQALLYALTF